MGCCNSNSIREGIANFPFKVVPFHDARYSLNIVITKESEELTKIVVTPHIEGNNYAFIFTKNVTSFLGPLRNIYILVCTNCFLIADYAAKQTRNYELIDMDYVKFLANMPVFRIEVAEQVVSVGAGYYPFQFKEKAVLLKNGEKVQESTLNTEYKNINPFSTSHLGGIQTNWQESANEVVRNTIKMADKITESYKDNSNVNLKNIPAPALKVNNLYEYKDIDIASKYEVVVIRENEEKRVAIDFSGIK